MRMPSFSDLDEEQLRVYNGAPPDGSVLVTGPPGTGKTIMAFHRARMLRDLDHSPHLIMYNTVLRSFTATGHDEAETIPVTTMNSWVSAWFGRMKAGSPPQIEPYKPNWIQVHQRVSETAVKSRSGAANWGHLIVDEGQDFPSDMYFALASLIGAHSWSGRAPALTVFADENQRLNEQQNSCIADIKSAMSLVGDGRVYGLRKNYRNTRQIAEFASHFYSGVSTGKPDIPTSKGPLPIVQYVTNAAEMAEAIANFVKLSPPMEVGVICSRDKDRKRLFRRLEADLGDEDETIIQTFKSGDANHGDARKMTFDAPGTVTVLNYQSAKGLEFDAVFVVDPFLRAAPGGAGQQQFMMNMYVMCSRARTHLRLLFETDRDTVLPHLPPKGTYKEVK